MTTMAATSGSEHAQQSPAMEVDVDVDESPASSLINAHAHTQVTQGKGDSQLSLNNSLSSENVNLDTLSREELYDKIRRLQTHVKQLRNIILKRKICHLEKYNENSLQTSMKIERDGSRSEPGSSGTDSPAATAELQAYPPLHKKKKQDRPFNFEKCPKRHIALKVAYLGWSYTGLAAQEDSDETIETFLFEALIKAKLIESRATSSYHRCGRTDKGVSAFSQVISIDVRCNSTSGLGVILPEGWTEANGSNAKSDAKPVKELDFCRMINRLLPHDIRVLAWAPVRADFSSRFDCVRRTYKYYFPAAPDLNVERMRSAAQQLIGDHDFQNFCKLETAQFRRARGGEQKSTVRTLISIELDKVESCPSTLYVLTIQGSSFVWHQIRCIVAILILIGKGLEAPSLITELLDIEAIPKKPHYAMAVDFPLVLFDVDHGDEIKEWIWSDTEFTLCCFQALWVQNDVKATIIAEMMNEIKKQLEKDEQKPSSDGNECPNPNRWQNEHLNALIMGTKAKQYQKILTRPTCERL